MPKENSPMNATTSPASVESVPPSQMVPPVVPAPITAELSPPPKRNRAVWGVAIVAAIVAPLMFMFMLIAVIVLIAVVSFASRGDEGKDVSRSHLAALELEAHQAAGPDYYEFDPIAFNQAPASDVALDTADISQELKENYRLAFADPKAFNEKMAVPVGGGGGARYYNTLAAKSQDNLTRIADTRWPKIDPHVSGDVHTASKNDFYRSQGVKPPGAR
jgi:hypothetical protein